MQATYRSIVCSECRDDFRYKIQLTEALMKANLLVKLSCPFCHALLKVELKPYHRDGTTVFRKADDQDDVAKLPLLDLPDTLPSSLQESS